MLENPLQDSVVVPSIYALVFQHTLKKSYAHYDYNELLVRELSYFNVSRSQRG